MPNVITSQEFRDDCIHCGIEHVVIYPFTTPVCGDCYSEHCNAEDARRADARQKGVWFGRGICAGGCQRAANASSAFCDECHDPEGFNLAEHAEAREAERADWLAGSELENGPIADYALDMSLAGGFGWAIS